MFNLLLPKILEFCQKYWAYIFAGMVIVALSLTAAWYVWAPKPAPPETYKPATVQADNSVVLEKKPDAAAKAPMMIPKGSTVEKIVKITVQAKNPIQSISGTVEVKETVRMDKAAPEALAVAQAVPECPPVNVTLALVRDQDQTRRVVASSDDGIILGGVDIPVENVAPVVPKVWAAGAVFDPFKQTYGAFVDRDLGWLRLGAQLNQRNQGDIPNQIWLKAGIRF